MIDPRCYRNRCHMYSLYWASQSEPPVVECEIEFNILELPESPENTPINNTININRLSAGTCDSPYLLEDTVFTYDGVGTLEDVRIVSVPAVGTLMIGERVIINNEELSVIDDFSEGLYYIPDESTHTSYTDTVLFQIKTDTEGYSGVGEFTISVSECTTSIEEYTACETFSLYFATTPY